MLCSHLGDHSEFLCRPGQLTCLINIMSQRFLTINMLPLSNRSHADGGVHVIRRGDGDGFNIGMLQQSPPVLVTLGPGKASRGPVEFPIIDITYGHRSQNESPWIACRRLTMKDLDQRYQKLSGD